MSARWTIFCSMIDNFGDIGVSWRLARQLVSEHGLQVDLWVDDWPALTRFLKAQGDTQGPQLRLRHWPEQWPDEEDLADSQVIIEAFGCELPVSLKAALARRQVPLLWVNLEYLSAEAWVVGCHGLPSPQSLSPLLRKYFFFPGFEVGTGGLLRERELIARHADWQQALSQNRQQLLTPLLGAELGSRHWPLLISVFSYRSTALESWLQALSEGQEEVLVLVPEGQSVSSVQGFFAASELVAGTVLQRGSVCVLVLPFGSQDAYDQLLSLCDLNIVRGEDSFVRAQWAARPLIWHIYPQSDGVHMDKLEAFNRLYRQGLPSAAVEAWQQFAWRWNQGEDCRELWHYLRPQLPVLQQHARGWQQNLADRPDLATNLVSFYQQLSET